MNIEITIEEVIHTSITHKFLKLCIVPGNDIDPSVKFVTEDKLKGQLATININIAELKKALEKLVL